MAAYTYQCSCGFQKVVVHKVAETPNVRCNQCTSKMIRAIPPSKDGSLRSYSEVSYNTKVIK